MQRVETAIHLTPADYDVIGEERFGQPGLVAVESIGPGMPVKTVGPLFIIHDSVFEPRHGIGHHPHRGMERLFYILEGAVAHDDAQNGITGHMGMGDLGILTEGRRGMLHSESNPTDGQTRCWILVYPCDPLVESRPSPPSGTTRWPAPRGRGGGGPSTWCSRASRACTVTCACSSTRSWTRAARWSSR